jgi:hypothetical protein
VGPMIVSSKQREYFYKEQKLFARICTMIGSLIVVSLAILYIWTNHKHKFEGMNIMVLFGVIIIFFLIIGSAFVSWEQKYKKTMFENETLEPNCYDLKEIGYKSFLNELRKTKSIYTAPDDSFHMLSISHEATPFKVFISRTNTLSMEEAGKMNLKCIERENHMEMDLSEDKSVRINLLFVDDFDFSVKTVVSHNATNSLSNKRYTTVVVDLNNEKLYVPSHYGLNNMKKYKRLHSLLSLLFSSFEK